MRRPPQEELSAEDKAKVRRLREHMERLVQSHYYLETDGPEGKVKKRREDGSKDPQGQLVEQYYEDWEYRWLDLEQGEGNTARRYLRAAKGNEEDAIKRLEVSGQLQQLRFLTERTPHTSSLYFLLTSPLWLGVAPSSQTSSSPKTCAWKARRASPSR